jgi:YD repeat-containing protein
MLPPYCGDDETTVFMLFLLVSPVFSGTIFYVYDELDRLHEVRFENGQKITYEYDQIGNLISKTPSAIGSAPDLVVSSVTAPANATTGQQVTVPVTIRNLGAIEAGGFYVNLYLSTDINITTSDTYLGQQYVSSLPAIGLQTINITATVPVVNSGPYYIGAIADATNMVLETNKTNNIQTSQQTSIIKCPSGYSLNLSSQRCEKAPECAAGTTYSVVSKKCEVSPVCSSGTYNFTSNQCVISGSYAATLAGAVTYNVPAYNGFSSEWTPGNDFPFDYCDPSTPQVHLNNLRINNQYCGIKGYISSTGFASSITVYKPVAYYSMGDDGYYGCPGASEGGAGLITGNSLCGVYGYSSTTFFSGAISTNVGYIAPSPGTYGGTYSCPSGGTLSGSTCITNIIITPSCIAGILDGASDKCIASATCTSGTLDLAANVCWAN